MIRKIDIDGKLQHPAIWRACSGVQNLFERLRTLSWSAT